jgi:acyl-[acyl-carrier-protein]-phospholipid O-acyltransferase/long-chain-fatty-acid--[acyl-carrier-protein] ligase
MARAESERAAFFRRLIETCRARRTTKVADSTGQELSGVGLLARALVVRRLLRRRLLGADERHVGILLPPAVGAVVANLGLALDRRVPVNLNYTLTAGLLNAGIAQAGIRHVLTSRRFAEKVPLRLDAEPIYLEDLAALVTPVGKAIAGAQARALPVGLLLKTLGLAGPTAGDEDVLTVVFTSGTTGAPKGAMLTHGNIAANLDAVDRLIRWRPSDVLLGVLPFFHSFGSTVTLWGPLLRDLTVAYHANPLEAQGIAKLCRERRATLIAATPVFLRHYLRRVEPADFATLDVVAVGAEKLPRELSDAFEAKFGVRPIEGYGTTEMSPLVAANTPARRATAEPGAWSREGTVGRPAPGVLAKVVDPETGAEVGPGERGMLWVGGPSLMKGYLGRPEATAEVVEDGWYRTGDIATIDGEGFITLVDRQSRFAKIAGEMVPHGAVEDALGALLGPGAGGTPRLVVTSVPDPLRGEKLVVVHTPWDAKPDDLRQGLAAAGLPNLFIPGRDAFVEVGELPVVGAGKLDLRRIKEMALEAPA